MGEVDAGQHITDVCVVKKLLDRTVRHIQA